MPTGMPAVRVGWTATVQLSIFRRRTALAVTAGSPVQRSPFPSTLRVPGRPLTSIFRRSTLVCSALSMLAPVVHSVSAQGCATTTSRTSLGEMSGRRVRALAVVTEGPTTLPSPADFLRSLRARTLSSTVWRQLLLAPGDTVDSLRVAESLRRLRREGIFSDVSIAALRCGDADSIDVTVTTRDAWTLQPIIRSTPPDAVAIGLEDRDLLGTGRTIAVTEQRSRTRAGASFSGTDPWLFGTNTVAALRVSRLGEVHTFRASLRNHENSIYDPWRAEGWVGRQSFSPAIGGERAIQSGFASFLVGHVTYASPTFVRKTLLGAELDSAAVQFSRAPFLPGFRSRRFFGAGVDVLQQAAHFDTVGWFVPNRGFVDVPVGLEGDGYLSLGHDYAQKAHAAHYDFWIGRVFLPTRARLVAADFWASGYTGEGIRTNHIDRLALSTYGATPGGFWGVKLVVEQLLQLDPDLRTLSLLNQAVDPSFAAVPDVFRLADRGIASSVERAFQIRPVARASVIDGGPFAAASVRWDAHDPRVNTLALAVVGLRLRLISANGAVGSTRLDVGYPIIVSGRRHRGPTVSISLGPLFDMARARDGRRREQ